MPSKKELQGALVVDAALLIKMTELKKVENAALREKLAGLKNKLKEIKQWQIENPEPEVNRYGEPMNEHPEDDTPHEWCNVCDYCEKCGCCECSDE